VEVLQAEGYRGVAAVDGTDAIGLFREQLPDFVCLDIMMPGHSGYEVCRGIRAEPCQGSCSDGTLTWGGVHPHSRILLPQADMPEPFRLHRSTRFVDQRKHIFSASVTAHLTLCRT